jgi:putative ABC transport system permease protein
LAQFFSESVLTSYLSLLIALFIMALALPVFNEVAAKAFSLSAFLNPILIIILLVLPLITGTLAGFYPAIFLSSFKPIEVLKSKINPGLSKSNLRSVLVTSQFVISLTLIIGTIIVYQQLDFIKTKNIGYNKEQVLILDGTSSLGTNQDAFKNEVLEMSGVQNGSQSNYLPVSNSSRSDNTFSKEAVMTEANGLNMQVWKIDYNYIPVLGMEIEKGRNFSKEFGADSSAVIINETASEMLGYSDPIGKSLYTSDGNSSNQNIKLAIVGVVKNFNFESLRENIGPLCFRLGNSKNTLIFKVNTGDLAQLVDQIESKWNAFAPDMPFSYRFLDDSFDEMYRAETRIGKVALIFSFLTILIACLGLFGLVTYLTEQRVKEIGIRKVLGANELSIVILILKNFLKLVFLAIVIACPLAYYFMKNWLDDFTYRIPISWWVFVLAGLVAITISLLTVSYHAIKASLVNPVKSLRSK